MKIKFKAGTRYYQHEQEYDGPDMRLSCIEVVRRSEQFVWLRDRKRHKVTVRDDGVEQVECHGRYYANNTAEGCGFMEAVYETHFAALPHVGTYATLEAALNACGTTLEGRSYMREYVDREEPFRGKVGDDQTCKIVTSPKGFMVYAADPACWTMVRKEAVGTGIGLHIILEQERFSHRVPADLSKASTSDEYRPHYPPRNAQEQQEWDSYMVVVEARRAAQRAEWQAQCEVATP